MKKYLISMFILIILFILVIGLPHYTLAAATDIYSNEFLDEFDPTKQQIGTLEEPVVNAIVNIVNPILGFLQIIGGIGAVISIAFYGFKHILGADPGMARDLGMPINDKGSPNIRIELYNWARVMLIGSLILFFSSTLVRIVYSLLTSASSSGG